MVDLPDIMFKNWYAIDWNVESIWKLDLPVGILPMSELDWHLDVPVWPNEDGRKYAVTPRQFLEFSDRHPAEASRISRASLEYPLEVYMFRGRYMILDGIHRMARAWQEGREWVRVRHVPDSAVRAIQTEAWPPA